MKNVMEFEGGYKALISYDADIEMFRGEFVGLNGGADFYAEDIQSLKREGQTSLNTFIEVCKERNLPIKKPEGKFALRLSPELYQQVTLSAKAQGVSINRFIEEALIKTIRAFA